METWDQMKRRHIQERIDLLERCASMRMTQTQAARCLGMRLQTINEYIRKYGIFWPVKAQGKPTHILEKDNA